jgi:signal transduction histidine kinase
MLFYAAAGILCSLALLFGIVSSIKLLRVKRQLADMTDALQDIQTGNGNRKILAPPNVLTADLAYKMNEIVYRYEKQLSVFKAADETNRQLMTSLSHDVRTPLTTLIGYLDAVHRGVAVDQDREVHLEIARRKAHDLKNYIDLLFDWFKLNSSEYALSLELVELAEQTRHILKDWVPIFEENHLVYEIDIPDKPLYAKIDIDGYTRILNNVVHNVIIHSQATEIRFEMAETEAEIEIRITDNGIGIEKADLQNIFERLYKCDKGRSNKGSGLGLSIVRQIAGKMSSRITVESEINQFTAFTVYLTRAK